MIKIWGAEVLFLFSRISGLTVFLSFSFIEFLIQINELNKIKTNKHKIKDKKAQNSILTKYMQTTKKQKNFLNTVYLNLVRSQRDILLHCEINVAIAKSMSQ